MITAIVWESLGHAARLAAAVPASVFTLVGVVEAGAISFDYTVTLYPIFLGYAVYAAIFSVLFILPSARIDPHTKRDDR
ncbi:MAG: hypothetical protein AAGA97_01120 [Pseudomonadota bacterium]